MQKEIVITVIIIYACTRVTKINFCLDGNHNYCGLPLHAGEIYLCER